MFWGNCSLIAYGLFRSDKWGKIMDKCKSNATFSNVEATFGKWYFFSYIKLYAQLLGNCPFFGCGQIRRGSHLTFHSCLSALSLIVWFMGDVPSYVRVSVPKTSFLLLSIKVQVVTMVWHSLSACGFAGLAPEQLGSVGCHIQPPAAVKDGRAEDECSPPCLCYKAPLKPQRLGIWAHGASPPSSTSKPCLRKQLATRSWNRKWSRSTTVCVWIHKSKSMFLTTCVLLS